MANLTHITPFFIVRSLQASISFYVDRLGFVVQFTVPDDDPYFARVSRNVSVKLKEIAPGVKPVPNHTLHGFAH